MATRACIARLLARDGPRFEGVLVERHGKPSETGRLLRAMAQRGGESLATWLSELLEDHPAGWSSFRKGVCLCGTGRPSQVIAESSVVSKGVCFVYAFDVRARTLLVLSVASAGVAREWVLLAEIALDGPEPDWAAIEKMAPA